MKEARHQAKKQGGQVFYSGNVTKHHIKSNGKDERILIITHLFISYYSKKGQNTNTNYWTDLKSISIQQKSKNILIKMTFDQNELMTFECSPKSKVNLIIFESIKYMSSGQKIRIDGAEFPITFSIIPRSIFNIFMSQIYLNNNNIEKQIKTSIRMICRLQSKVVGFLPEMVGPYFPFLLNAIANSNYVESFRIPELPDTDVYSCLSKFLKSDKYEYSSIIHLQISKQGTKSFKTFCESLSKEKSVKNRISGLTFTNSELNQDQLKTLSEAIINSKWNNGYEINSIKFENAINDDVNFVDSFFPNLASIASANSPLKLFSLNRMKVGDVNQFISLLKGVRVLSLSYMGIEISSIFEAISNTGMEELMFLNVSGNFLNETVSNVKKLPSSLQRLDVNEVDFLVKNPKSEKGNMLIDFFISVLNKKWNSLFYLSISHIFCHNNNEGSFQPDQALQKLFSKLKKLEISECQILKGLSFSANFINDDFFEFVKKCKNLKSLYLDFCLHSDSPYLKSFCDVLRTSLPNLNVLSFRGDLQQNKVLGENFIMICRALKKLKSLQCLILADNMIGTKGLEELSKLFDPTIDFTKEDVGSEVGQKDENSSDDESSSSSSSSNNNKKKKKKSSSKNNKKINKNDAVDNKNYTYDTLNSISFDNCNAGSIMPIISVAGKAAKLGRPIAIDYPTQEVWRLKQSQIADKPQIIELRETLELCLKGGRKSDINNAQKEDADFKPIYEYWMKPFSEHKVATNDFFPDYLSPEVLTEIYSPEKVKIEPDQSKVNNDQNKNKKKEQKKKDILEDSESESESKSSSSDDKKKKKKKKDESSDESESDSNISKKSKKKKKKKNQSEDEEEDENSNKKKNKNKSRKKRSLESDSEVEESESESEVDSRSKKQNKNMKNSKKKRKNDSESEEEDSNDDEFTKKRKKNNKNSKKKRKQESESDSEEEEEDSRRKKRKKSSKKKQKFDSESEEDSEDDDEFNKKRNKNNKNSKKKRKQESESESEEEEDSRNKKRKKSSKRKQKFDSESEEDSEDDNKSFKKRKSKKSSKMKKFDDSEDDDRLHKSEKKNKKVQYLRDPDSEDDNESDDDYFNKGSNWKMASQKTKRTNLDSDSDDSNQSSKRKNSNRSKRSSRKRDINSDSDFDDSTQSDSDMKQSNKNHKKRSKRDDLDNNDDEYDDSDNNQSYPLSIDSKKEKKMIHNLKKKFSINHLQEEIMNN